MTTIDIPEITVNARQLQRIGLKSLQARMGFMSIGASGCGKTAIMYQILEAYEELTGETTRVIYKTPAVEESIDWRGMAEKNEKLGGYDFSPIGEMRLIFEDGTEPVADLIVVYLDDFSQAPKSVQAGAMPFLLNNRDGNRIVHGRKIRDNVVFVASANRRSDKCGANGVLEAVTGRTPTILTLEATADDWIDWALQNDVAISVVSFIKLHRELLWVDSQNLDMQKHGTPRNWVELSHVTEWGLSDEDKLAAYAGAVGRDEALTFIEYELLFNTLPDVDMIALDPMGSPIPEDKPGTMWALCATMVQISTLDNFEALIQYANRFTDREYLFFFVLAAVRKHPELTSTHAFQKWARENQDLIH